MTEKTYEMMWDCEFCGEQKLLGVTHRFCPNCGAAQNPQKRYFPDDNQKVAVQDHQYVGADRHCPACSQAQSAAVKHCANCGSPMEAGSVAHQQQDQVVGPGGAVAQAAPGQVPPGMAAPGQAPPVPEKKSGKSWVFVVIGVVVLAVIALIIMRFVWKEKTGVEVTGHTWTRTIEIERYDKFKESGACKNVPSGSKVTKRTQGKKTCKTRKVDQGDGTFKEKKECKQPEEQCQYEVKKWKTARTLKESGDLDDEPIWPKVTLNKKGKKKSKKKVGSEREGKRTESYTVVFKDDNSGDTEKCSFSDKSKWKSFEKGAKYKAEKYGLGGDLDCDSLKK